MIFPILFLLMLAFWIYAERRHNTAVRIGSGLACMVILACGIHFIDGILPSYEREFHKSALRLSGELISKGETTKVKQAIGTYNGIAATGTTYHAAMEMWTALNQPTNSTARKP